MPSTDITIISVEQHHHYQIQNDQSKYKEPLTKQNLSQPTIMTIKTNQQGEHKKIYQVFTDLLCEFAKGP